MIKFFRKIRQNLLDEGKLKRYLIYAIGEILLVMVGILLALQFNNLNEKRKERILKVKYIDSFLLDIENDINSLVKLDTINRRYEQHGEYLLAYLEESLIEVDTNRLYHSLAYSHFKPSYKVSSGTYNDLVSSGNLRIFDDLEVKKSLDRYYTPNDWDLKYDERIIQTMWYDYWNELHTHIDPNLYDVIRKNEIVDFSKFPIDHAGIKNDFLLKKYLKMILYDRGFIHRKFNSHLENAKYLSEVLKNKKTSL